MKKLLVGSLAAAALFALGCSHEAASQQASATTGAQAAEAVNQTNPNPQQPLTLKPYDSPSGFRVLMPDNPQVSVQNRGTLAGNVQTTIVQANRPDRQLGFVATQSILPPVAAQSMDAESLLKSAQDSTVKELNGTLLTQQDITEDGLPGREFTLDSPHGRTTGRVLYNGGQMYTLMVTYPSGMQAPPQQATDFLGSFKRGAPNQGVGGAGVPPPAPAADPNLPPPATP